MKPKTDARTLEEQIAELVFARQSKRYHLVYKTYLWPQEREDMLQEIEDLTVQIDTLRQRQQEADE